MLRILPLLLLLLSTPAIAGTSLHSWNLDDPSAIDCPVCADTYQCVAGAYSELWQPGLFFTDPVPAGNTVTGVDVVLHGVFGCDAPSTAEISLDGALVEAKALPGTCECGDCQSHTFTALAPGGWSNYAYGAENRLDFVTAGNFCIDLVELVLTWESNDPRTDDDDASGDDDDASDDDDELGGDDDDGADDDDASNDDDASDDDAAEPDGEEAVPNAVGARSGGLCSSAGAGPLLWLLPLVLRRRR